MFYEEQDPDPATFIGGAIKQLRNGEARGDLQSIVTLKVITAAYNDPRALTEAQIQLAWMIAAQTIMFGMAACHDEKNYERHASDPLKEAAEVLERLGELKVPKDL